MINLSTPPNKLLEELLEDKIKAKYWFIKKIGGDRKLNSLMGSLITKSERSKKNEISDVIEYNSANGNRWLIFACARYYEEAYTSSTSIISFCYYETYGSVGAFVPTTENEYSNETNCIIYTSHFFLRFCDRIGLKYRTREMVRAFIEHIPFALTQIYKDGDKMRVDIRLPNSVGRGFVRDDDNRVIEIRTFLRDAELTNKQLRETQALRDNEHLFKVEPMHIKFARAINSANPLEVVKQEFDKVRQLMILAGIKEEDAENHLNILVWVSYLLNSMGVDRAQDCEEWYKNGDKIIKHISDFCKESFTYDSFFELVEKCSKIFGCKKFDLYRCKELMFNLINNEKYESKD